MSEENKIPPEEIPQEQPINKEPSDETKTSAEAIAEVEQPQTEDNQTQTEENMEVHHHSHESHGNPPAGRAGKNWKTYFWEFLMLFLAVFCGFFAEYQLEHKIEKDREKQFIQSLAYDIKADTASLKNLINARTVRDGSLDSLSWLMNSNAPAQHTIDIYFYAITASRTRAIRFVPNDGTVQQLKNSGAFRLIRSREVADSIAKYDVNVRNFIRQQEVEETQIYDYRQASGKMFNPIYFEQMLDADVNPTRLTAGNPPLLNYEKTDLENWNYRLYGMKTISKANRRDARSLLRQAENLLITLNKKYQLE